MTDGHGASLRRREMGEMGEMGGGWGDGGDVMQEGVICQK